MVKRKSIEKKKPRTRIAPQPERWALANALFARPDPKADAMVALRTAYPAAPQEMLFTAAHHVYGDGVVAAIDFVAEAERFLRDPSKEMSYAPTLDLLYHVYNWHQFRALLPDGKPHMLELLRELKEFVADGDREAMLLTVAALEEAFEGNLTYPDFDA